MMKELAGIQLRQNRSRSTDFTTRMRQQGRIIIQRTRQRETGSFPSAGEMKKLAGSDLERMRRKYKRYFLDKGIGSPVPLFCALKTKRGIGPSYKIGSETAFLISSQLLYLLKLSLGRGASMFQGRSKTRTFMPGKLSKILKASGESSIARSKSIL